MAAAIGIAAAAQAAGACSVEEDGPSAYDRVKARLVEIYDKSPAVSFPASKAIDASVDSNCVFTLKGPFQVKNKTNIDFLKFDVKLARKSGAPMGWQILKLQKGK